MQSINETELLELKNPKGLEVIVDLKAPTLFKIVNNRGRTVGGTRFSSRIQAVNALHRMLEKENKKKGK